MNKFKYVEQSSTGLHVCMCACVFFSYPSGVNCTIHLPNLTSFHLAPFQINYEELLISITHSNFILKTGE